jgi:hypothetical protein
MYKELNNVKAQEHVLLLIVERAIQKLIKKLKHSAQEEKITHPKLCLASTRNYAKKPKFRPFENQTQSSADNSRAEHSASRRAKS